MILNYDQRTNKSMTIQQVNRRLRDKPKIDDTHDMSSQGTNHSQPQNEVLSNSLSTQVFKAKKFY